MELPVHFESGGNRLSGIVHLPQSALSAAPELGVVFVHSGSRGRRGNTFQYPMYARELATRGIPSLRFDPAGYGDSEGELETLPVDDLYGAIQLGRFVDDTVAAVEELYRHCAPRQLVLFGICGGAITALLAAPRVRRRVHGLVLISIPVLIDSSAQDPLQRIPKDYARKYLVSLYARKLLSAAAWRRLLTRQSEVETIWKMVKATVLGAGKRSISTAAGQDASGGSRFNRLFLESLDASIKSGRVIFLFGDDDEFRWEFEREFYNIHWQRNPAYAERCEVHYLAGCNHMFTMREWQRQALERVSRWLPTL